MNTGLISSRYATALLKYVEETGGGAVVSRQVVALEKALGAVPDLQRALGDGAVVTPEQKLSLLKAALGEPMAPELERFIVLLLKNGREEYCKFIFHHFTDVYNRRRGVRFACLTTVSEASPELIAALKDLVRRKTGCEVVIETSVDPDLIGGFVFDIDDSMIDASARRQLELIRRAFIEKNRRIV